MRVKFTEEYLYETEGRGKGPTFKADEVKEFRDDIAERFIRRGVAVKFDGVTRAPPPPPPPKGDGGKANDAGGKADGGKGDGGKADGKQ